VNPNRRAGRFNWAGKDETQYTCLDSEAPNAEMLRAENLRTPDDVRSYSTILWQLEVEVGAVADYSSFEKADAAGFPADALVDDDHERCQHEADRLRARGAGGILSPSAALPESTNLSIFGPRVPVDWGTPITLASMVPVQRIAEGHAPLDLVDRVRYYGEEHAELKAYQSAQQPLFKPPSQPKPRRSPPDHGRPK
jgi:hypothetical protein